MRWCAIDYWYILPFNDSLLKTSTLYVIIVRISALCLFIVVAFPISYHFPRHLFYMNKKTAAHPSMLAFRCVLSRNSLPLLRPSFHLDERDFPFLQHFICDRHAFMMYQILFLYARRYLHLFKTFENSARANHIYFTACVTATTMHYAIHTLIISMRA